MNKPSPCLNKTLIRKYASEDKYPYEDLKNLAAKYMGDGSNEPLHVSLPRDLNNDYVRYKNRYESAKINLI